MSQSIETRRRYWLGDQLHSAIKHHLPLEVKALLDPETPHSKHTSFQVACAHGNPEIMRIFLDCKRPIQFNATCDFENLAGIYTSLRDPTLFRMLVEDPRIDVNAGAQYSLVHRLHWHVSGYMISMIKVLLACDRLDSTTVDRKDDTGRTGSDWLKIRAKVNEDHEYLEVANIIDAYIQNPELVREQFRRELGYAQRDASELFATIVLACDGYYEIKEE